MGGYLIHGGRKISGSVKVGGGKNAILPILASTVLNSSESIIHNAPGISDSYITCEMLRSIGCGVKWEDSTMIISSENANEYRLPEKLVREMRSSIIFLGAVLARFKKVKISHPGGCDILLEGFIKYNSTVLFNMLILLFG